MAQRDPEHGAAAAALAPQAPWVEAFVTRLQALGARAAREHLVAMAHELWPQLQHVDPVRAADAEWALWPPHDD